MSKLAEFRALEQQLAAQLAELEALKNDGGLKKEIEFENKLRALMAEYGVSLNGVINILDPQASRRAPVAALASVKSVRSRSTSTLITASALKPKVATTRY